MIRSPTEQDLTRVITVLASGREAERALLIAVAQAVLQVVESPDLRAALVKVQTTW